MKLFLFSLCVLVLVCQISQSHEIESTTAILNEEHAEEETAHEEHNAPQEHESQHSAEHDPHADGEGHHHSEEHGGQKYSPGDAGFYFSLFMAIFLVCFAGICSGLTVGLLSIDDLSLEIKQENGTEADKKAAKAIRPILKDHHILLSTLLISNAIAMEALPIFLDAIVPAYLAIIISTVAVVVVGEIVPQAYCTGPQQLIIAEKMAPLVRVLIFTFKIFTTPIAKFLDWLLGVHGETRYTSQEITQLVALYESMIPKCLNCQLSVEKIMTSRGEDFKCRKCEQPKKNMKEFFWCARACYGQQICVECHDSASFLYSTEITVFKAVLEKIATEDEKKKKDDNYQIELISNKSGFIPIEKVVMVEENECINKKTLHKINDKCFSSVLVRSKEKNDIVGVIKIKNLIPFVDQDTNIEFKSRMYTALNYVQDDCNFLDLINSFKGSSSTTAIVLSPENQETKDAIRKQELSKLQENQYDINNYSSLVPTKQISKKLRSNQNNLEHNGQKILGIFTLKDVFEELINIDFGESNAEDQAFREKMEEEVEKQPTSTQQPALASASGGIHALLGKSKGINNMVLKAANKFKGSSQNKLNTMQPSQDDKAQMVRDQLAKKNKQQKQNEAGEEEPAELEQFPELKNKTRSKTSAQRTNPRFQ